MKEKDEILNIIWEVLHEGHSLDMISDQDYVYEIIRNKIENDY